MRQMEEENNETSRVLLIFKKSKDKRAKARDKRTKWRKIDAKIFYFVGIKTAFF